ncbi:hypothetical protein PG999_006733 [Apiospora kogelbergensis]|uniref:Uncharacterized protein n=1 Tax=Apiospora kogelbergensis TaxID=1337665 RepID=A0AAW0QWB7_9PEZI
MAEEMAEEELMRAGKRSGLFDSSKSSSTASSNPFFRNLTPSLISIESCPSDEERTDGNDHYELATAADGSDEEEEDTTASKENPKQLEFSSSDEQNRKTSNRGYNGNHAIRTTQNHEPITRDLYKNHGMESAISSHSSDFRPPTDGSSLLAHTGHSMDNVPIAGSQPPVAESAALVATCDPDFAIAFDFARFSFADKLPYVGSTNPENDRNGLPKKDAKTTGAFMRKEPVKDSTTHFV